MKVPAKAIVYTETVVHVASEQYAADVPYQVAIVEWTNQSSATERLTVRILAATQTDRVRIGDRVTFLETRNGIHYFHKGPSASSE